MRPTTNEPYDWEAACERRLRATQEKLAAETARADREALAHGCSEGVIHAVIHRIGGIVEGNPTGRHNFLQRVDALVEAEARADREAARVAKCQKAFDSLSEQAELHQATIVREAAARQEAEQKLGEAEGWLAFHKWTKEAAYGANLALVRERRELTAERDRLHAELAALRGTTP